MRDRENDKKIKTVIGPLSYQLNINTELHLLEITGGRGTLPLNVISECAFVLYRILPEMFPDNTKYCV